MKPAPWSIGPISIATADRTILIPGWDNGVFGIDWRPGGEAGMAYVITHLASGWSMFAMLANLEDVQGVADRLTEQFDWPAGGLSEVRSLIDLERGALRKFRDLYELRDPGLCLPPPGDHLRVLSGVKQ